MSRLLILTALLVGCARLDPVEIAANAAFSPDGDAVLIAGSARLTAGDAPWFFDPGARDWEVVFWRADPALGARQEVARLADRSPDQGGGILSAPLWWLPERSLAIALEYHEVAVYDLDTPARRAFTLPQGALDALFLVDDLDLRPYAAPMALAPSPAGDRIAVHYTAALLQDGAFGELSFYHAVAFFDLDGGLIASDDLAPFRGGTHQLRRQAPLPEPMFPTAEPPAHQALRPVPAHDVVTFVWEADGGGVVFARSDLEDGVIVRPLAVRVDAVSGDRTQVEAVPPVGLPAPGGPVSADGVYLLLDEPEGAPDAAGLALHRSERHRPWGSGPDVPVEEIGFTW